MCMDPLAAKIAFKYEQKEKKEHKVERLTKQLRDATGLSKGQAEAICDAFVRGRDVNRLAVQKNWPVEDGIVTGPNGSRFDLRNLG